MDKLSEKSLSFCHKVLTHYPLGSGTNQSQIQPYSHMHDHRKERQIYDKTTSEKLENMEYFKNLGNTKFKQNNYAQALYFYQKTIIYGDYTFPDLPIDLHNMQLLLGQANMNSAICYIKQKQWTNVQMHLREAIKNVTKGFESYEKCSNKQKKKVDNICQMKLKTEKKGYYWGCKYQLNNSNYQEAIKYLNKLEQLGRKIDCKEEIEGLEKEIQQEKVKHETQRINLSKKMFKCSE